MKLGKGHIKNFGPYKELEFDFYNQGLALISGPTKVGKSTIMDMVAWLLYGVTSKDSAADDMHSWFTDEPTEGSIQVYTRDGYLEVFRVRGKASENDLCWVPGGYEEEPVRGKDLKDTQRLLEEQLGVSAELFVIGSYMHQFSNADTFFISKAKERREVLEKLADLSLPIKISTRAAECRKEKKKELEELNQQKAKLEGMLLQTKKSFGDAVCRFEQYERDKGQKMLELEEKSDNFETERLDIIHKMVSKLEKLDKFIVDPKEIEVRLTQVKTQIASLEQAKKEHLSVSKKYFAAHADCVSTEREYERLVALKEAGACPTCAAPVEHNDHFKQTLDAVDNRLVTATNVRDSLNVQRDKLEKAISVEKKIHDAYDKVRDDNTNNDAMIKEASDLRTRVLADKNKPNHYTAMIKDLNDKANPYKAQIESATKAIDGFETELKDTAQYIADTEHLIASLTWLYDKSFELRANMLDRAKNELADKTNAYLEKYFDACLRIKLTFEGSDKLNVDIVNEGYPCPYKQLSGGERCILKLTFNLALMKRAEDVASIKFSTIMLDEALNGLDADLKTKAFNMLQSLESEYDSILLIDHFPEFKNLFTNQYLVSKENGYSVVQHE